MDKFTYKTSFIIYTGGAGIIYNPDKQHWAETGDGHDYFCLHCNSKLAYSSLLKRSACRCGAMYKNNKEYCSTRSCGLEFEEIYLPGKRNVHGCPVHGPAPGTIFMG